MGLYNNVPTFSYIHATGITVVWGGELYNVQDFSTNKKYIYWTSTLPNQLNASNVMPNRSTSQYLVLINDNGIATEVPSTSEDFNIAYDGNSTQAIKDRIFGLYEKNEQLGNKFVAIEQDIDGIKQIVGENGTMDENFNEVWEKISVIEQKSDEIDLSVKEVAKNYNDDKETNKIREDLNGSIITINSTLATFKGELTDYFKNNEIIDEESIKITTQLEILENQKASVDGCVDTVILIAEKNNQIQDVVALKSAKQALQNAHNNLKNNVSNAVLDKVITPTETTIVIDAFAKYNLRLNELKKTCDDIIILGLGGVLIEELANINIKSDEIRLSVSKVESDFKSDMSVQKIEFDKQINDVNTALENFEETVNTTFKDGIIDETEKQLLEEKINLVDKEKVDVDLKYNSIIEDINLSETLKVELTTKYNEYCTKHNELKEKVNSVISDAMINDAEKLEVNTLFKQYSNTLAYFSALVNKAIEDISFNTSKAELEQAKNELKAEIEDVKESVDGVQDFIDGTFEDNILDEIERKNIEQNLETLSREKIDIDNTYNNMYASEYLTGEDKDNFKLVYDKYIEAYNEVVTVSNGILDKDTLVSDVDRVNLNSAIAAHKDKLNLFFIEANKVAEIISVNKSNNLKEDIQQEIADVNDRIDDVLSDIGGAIGDGVIDQAEALIVKESLENIQKEKSDIDAKYEVIYENTFLDGEIKVNLATAKSEFDIATINLINIVNTIIEDEKVTDEEKTSLDNIRNTYKKKSATLSKRFEEAIEYISQKQAEDVKEELRRDVEELNNSINNLEETMNGAFQDGILTEAEKLSIKQHLLTISSEKSDIDKRYTTLFANEDLDGSAKTNLTTAYNNYITSYNNLITVINNILNKEGLIDSADQTKLNNAFKDHDLKLATYSQNDINALDYISNKKAETESEKVDKKYAEIILTPETGIQSIVGHLNEKISGNGGIEQRLQTAEQLITPDGITNIVKDTQFIKDLENGVTTNTENITKIDQKADSISLSVSSKADKGSIISAINMSPETIKINASKINISGFVTFSDLSTSGYTTINGSNITTGTINGSLANITNINASNINTGVLNGDLISGGTIKGALLQTYADDNTKGVRIAKESMQLNNASLFYETNGGFNIQCKEQMAIGSMNDIYIMPGLNSSGTSTGNGSVVIPNATLRPQNLYVVNNASVGGNLACNGSVSGSSLSTSGNITASNGNITASNGNISGGNLYAQGSQIQLSYGYGTVGGFGYLGHYYLTLNGHKLAKPASGSGMYAFCVTNSSGQTGYINAHLSTNTYSSDIVKVVNEEGYLKQSELYEVCEIPNGKILVPKIMESSIKADNIEDVLRNNMCAIDEDGVIHNNINNIVYSLWNMNMELKKEIEDLKSRIG